GRSSGACTLPLASPPLPLIFSSSWILGVFQNIIAGAFVHSSSRVHLSVRGCSSFIPAVRSATTTATFFPRHHQRHASHPKSPPFPRSLSTSWYSAVGTSAFPIPVYSWVSE
ncbi:unnamed protein product, partial [Scytosiphon promiscuus]